VPERKDHQQGGTELKMHAVVGEEISYPAVRKHVGSDNMNEAYEERHVARLLVAELDLDRRSGSHPEAKFSVLTESARHQIVLPKANELDIDFEALSKTMLDRKKELKENRIPKDTERFMVARVNEKGRRQPRRRVKMGQPTPGSRRAKDLTPVTSSKQGEKY
jgi:hypothetical protein